MDAAFDSNGTFYARSLAANGMHSCPKNYERPFLLPAFFRFFCQTQQQDNETSDGQRIERQIERLLLHRRGRGIGEAAIGSSEIR